MWSVRRAAGVVVAAGVAACGLVACGGGDGATGSQAPPTDTVRLTVIAPAGTSAVAFPGNIAAVRAAAKAVNDSGGVSGRKIEVKVCDDRNVLADATECAHSAVRDGSAAVVGSFTTFGAQVTRILASAGIPYVGSGTVDPAEYTCQTCYTFDAGSVLVFAGLPGGLRTQGVTTVMPIIQDLPGAATFLQGVSAASKAAGLRVVGQVKIAPTSGDMGQVISTLTQAGAQAGIPVLPVEQAPALIQAADSAHADITLGVTDAQVQNVRLDITPSAEKRLFVVSTYPPVGDVTTYPGLARYAQEMDSEVEAGDKDASIRDSASLRAWLSVHVVAEVAQSVRGQVTPTSLTAAFTGATNIDLFGILPAWTPSAQGTVPGFERASNAEVFFLRLQSGSFVAAKPIKGVNMNTRQPLP
jgi:ABC-type branched-subunit amino acid transport system substrate-binding protein